MLRSPIGAPPRMGPEQHLRRKRPQEPGGCAEYPIALRLPKLGYIFACRTCLQRIISRPGIRYSDEFPNRRRRCHAPRRRGIQ